MLLQVSGTVGRKGYRCHSYSPEEGGKHVAPDRAHPGSVPLSGLVGDDNSARL